MGLWGDKPPIATMPMQQAEQYSEIVAELEQSGGLRGKRIADVPGLAMVRLTARRWFYRMAEAGFFLAVFNLWLASAPAYPLWAVSMLSAGLCVVVMVKMELGARAMTRQLARPAAEQVARDLLGIRG
jgi:hypothetical protein